jgi:hypothetical protein
MYKKSFVNVCIPNAEATLKLWFKKHLHQWSSVCDPALGILDEVHHSNPKNPLEELWEMLST